LVDQVAKLFLLLIIKQKAASEIFIFFYNISNYQAARWGLRLVNQSFLACPSCFGISASPPCRAAALDYAYVSLMFLLDVGEERRVAQVRLAARANERPILLILLGTF
jgi:hypothetical protein